MEQSRNGGGKVAAFEEAMMGRHRNGSLSTYLDIGRDVATGRVARPLQPQGAVSRRRTYADGELDVFSAERYFKGAMDGDRHKEDGVAVVVPPPAPLEIAAASARPTVAVAKPVGTRASAASVSARSATSANSRTMLLRGGHRRRDHREKKCCVQVGALMRSCSGKRSVRVDSGVAKEVPGTGEPTAASKIDWYKELRMQKAALGIAGDGSNHGVVAAAALPPNLNLSTAKVAAIGREVIREDKPAEFTSSSSRRRSFTLVAPVRASVLANGRVGDDAGGGGNEHNEDDDDGAGSESSSDLFEIKSLMIDDCPYEPSEASIQWSVATADAASERGDRVSARWMTGGSHRGRDGGREPVAGRQNRDRPAALLSGCVNHRAVEVSAAATAVPNAPRRRCEGCQKARN